LVYNKKYALKEDNTMDMTLKSKFLEAWTKYFNGAELPFVFYYTDQEPGAEKAPPVVAHSCILGMLTRVRNGISVCFDSSTVGCGGGKRYLGYAAEVMPYFDYFLSCGIPMKVEGERYKKSPELVRSMIQYVPKFTAPAKYIVFKRFDKIEASDKPDVVIFYALPDILSGLFTLANYDRAELNGVITPFCAGCGAIVMYPYLEKNNAEPRAVLGMFDVSARPFVPKETLSFSIPIKKFIAMVNNMDESFLIGESWAKALRRNIKQQPPPNK
jgi:uncharacterized protein (DUF169 family)